MGKGQAMIHAQRFRFKLGTLLCRIRSFLRRTKSVDGEPPPHQGQLGHVLTAATMNAHIKDNLAILSPELEMVKVDVVGFKGEHTGRDQLHALSCALIWAEARPDVIRLCNCGRQRKLNLERHPRNGPSNGS